MKMFCRINLANAAVFYLVAIASPFSISDFDGDLSSSQLLLFLWGAASVVAGFVWWVYLVYHWAVTTFKESWFKAGWLIVLMLGTIFHLFGPLLYYFIVVELGYSVNPPQAEQD